MRKIININNNILCYNENAPIHIREYYNYCGSLIAKKLKNIKNQINLVFGTDYNSLNNNNKTITTDIQVEHTLVKQGGRGVNNILFGTTMTEEGDPYLVRLDNFDYFNNLDFVIEYSKPNINHIRTSGLFDDYLNKLVYVAPLIYDLNFSRSGRSDTITLFTDNPSERRRFEYKNISNCYGNSLVKQYDKTKILVNVHQTDHHHTFEELRVLPALLRGVLIVSEDVPRKQDIPYREYIIWSSYDKIIDKVAEVQSNYDYYHEKIFNSLLKRLLKKMKDKNNYDLEEKIYKLC